MALRSELAGISRREAVLADRLAARMLEPDTYALAADALLSERMAIEGKLAAGVTSSPDVDATAARTMWDLGERAISSANSMVVGICCR
jgi:hypothetical protein